MSRKLATRSLGLLLGGLTLAIAADGPPPLTLPGGGSVPVTESPEQIVPVPAPVRPVFRPTYPGLPTLEPSGPSLTVTEADLPPITDPDPEPPPLTLPEEASPPGALLPEEGTATPPLTLESMPVNQIEPSTTARSSSTRLSTPAPSSPAPRRFRLLSRFQAAPAPVSSPTRSTDEAVKVEPRTDPAADAALKRRLETQIRAAVGPHLRDLDVRVIDRGVIIHARADRFWRRRAVRRAIESLPALSGLKVKVDVDGD
ncbi:MAG: hypothetical protein ABI353_01590 [Isosphaeraceae bacterium]